MSNAFCTEYEVEQLYCSPGNYEPPLIFITKHEINAVSNVSRIVPATKDTKNPACKHLWFSITACYAERQGKHISTITTANSLFPHITYLYLGTSDYTQTHTHI